MTIVAYSCDLRVRVIEYIKEGNRQKLASKTFKVSTTTVSRWYKEYEKEGRIKPKLRGGSKGKINLKLLQDYVDANPNKTLLEIGRIFKVSAEAIRKRLNQLNYRYKKKSILTWKLVHKEDPALRK